MKMITVIPLQKTILKDVLTYFSTKDIPDGSIVSIPVRNKKILGLTIHSEEVINVKSKIKEMDFNLKKIIELKEISLFRKEFLETIILASKYFASNRANTITTLIPSSFREEYDKISKIKNETFENQKEKENQGSKIKAEKLLFQATLSDRISYYKTLIRESFARKKSIFIVLPTEHEIEIFQELFSKGIENFIISFHGNLSAKKQIEKFEKVIISKHPILILGTAQFLSLPRYDLGTIILENEKSGSYKTIGRNSLDLRIFTEIFAVKIGAKLILGDTLLRFETLAREYSDNFGELYPLSFRIIPRNCNIKIFDKKREKIEEKITPKEKFKILSEESIKEIAENSKKGKNTFIFSLRKGLATMTICRDCHNILLCEKCLAPIVLYLSRDNKKRMFICNKCANEKSALTTCPNCQSWNLFPLGIGTDTVFEEIKSLFPKNKIFKLDKESATTAKQAEKIITEFDKSIGSILIGTEMALFYLQKKVPLSIIASFDSLWSIPNFKINEKIIHILISIISKTEKELIIETKNKDDSAILAIVNENLLSFFRNELEDRKKLGYPPFKRFIKISFSGNKEEALKARKFLTEFLKDYQPEIFSGFIGKLNNKYVTNALVKIEPKNWSLPELSNNSSIDENLLGKLLALQPSFSIDIDPEDLL